MAARLAVASSSIIAVYLHDLEDNMEKVLEIYIRTAPERLWEAITKRESRALYQHGVSA